MKLEKFLKKKLPVTEAAGGLVYNNKKEILFIHRNSKWDLPKGGLEKGESHKEAAIREVEEETGVKDLEIRAFITKTYHVFKRNDTFKLKIKLRNCVIIGTLAAIVTRPVDKATVIDKLSLKNVIASSPSCTNKYSSPDKSL